MKIAVLTDIHAVHDCAVAALGSARREGFDVLLILGDLLTYGVTPAETLDLISDAVARDGAILVTGNHDQMYLDRAGTADYRARLPDWLRETIDWTAARIEGGAMQDFNWQESWSSASLFASHANPGAFGDWTYLANDTQADGAALALAERGYRYGIFGHTHRARRFDREGMSLFTLGSLGQPRDDRDRRPQWTMVTLDKEDIAVEPHAVAFDRNGHLAAIRATTLSPATQDRLCGFFA